MKHSTKKPTPAEQSRLDALHNMQCMCCEIEGVAQPFPTEAQHLVDKGTRKHSGGHSATIPLCAWHHRGICLDGLTGKSMAMHYGPSLALSKRTFCDIYGTERELLMIVDNRLSCSS